MATTRIALSALDDHASGLQPGDVLNIDGWRLFASEETPGRLWLESPAGALTRFKAASPSLGSDVRAAIEPRRSE
jgi:hypothetical protein